MQAPPQPKKTNATKQPMVKKAAKQEKAGGKKFLIGGVVVGILFVGAGVMPLGGRNKEGKSSFLPTKGE